MVRVEVAPDKVVPASVVMVMAARATAQAEDLGPEGMALSARIWVSLVAVWEARALDFIPGEHLVPEFNFLPSVVPAPRAETRVPGTLWEGAEATLPWIRMRVDFG